MKDVRSVYSMLIDGVEKNGLVDVVEVKKNELTKREQKHGAISVISSEAPGAGSIVVGVLAGSELDVYFQSAEHLTAPDYSATVASQFFEYFSACDNLARMIGSSNLTMTVCATALTKELSMSAEASAFDRAIRQYTLEGSVEVQANVINI